jgi:hypothetical protein
MVDVWKVVVLSRNFNNMPNMGYPKSSFTVPLKEYESSIHPNRMDKITWYSTCYVLEYYH